MATDATSGSEPATATRPLIGRLARTVIAFAVVGALGATFSISFAALIFSGGLAPYLGTGITFVLAGAVVMAVLAARQASIPGTIFAPQDATAVLLAGGAATLVAGYAPEDAGAALPDVLALIFVSTLAAGLAALACHRFRLGELVRFLPFPVIGGFLAATGYLLVVGGIGMMVGSGPGFLQLVTAIGGAPLVAWLPWTAGGVALALATRRLRGEFVLPVFILLAAAAFYGLLALSGLGLAGAREAGLLLGPFEQFGFSEPPGLFRLGEADLWALLSMLPTIAAVAGMTVLGTLLNLSGLEAVIRREARSDRELKASGTANIAAALVGGIPGYSIMAETVLAHRMGLKGALGPLAAAAGCLTVLLFGPSLLSAVPIGLLALLIVYIGADFLIGWLWDRRGRMSARDRGIIVLILAVAALVGFLEAIAAGLLAATAIFVISYARLDVVRLRTTGAHRRSRVERSDKDLARLSGALAGTVIYELAGYLFFGTAHKLLEQVRTELAATDHPDAILIDGSRLDGIDISAVEALSRLAETCAEADVAFSLTGFTGGIEADLLRARPELKDDILPTLDIALERLEDAALERGSSDWSRAPLDALLQQIEAMPDLAGEVARLKLQPGETLLRAGDTSREIYVVVDGSLLAEITNVHGGRSVIAKFRPGAMIGEIAHYAAVPRTATIRAESYAEVVRIGEAAIEAGARDPVAELHRMAATHLARRVMRLNRLFSDAGL